MDLGKRFLFAAAALLCLFPFVSSPLALGLGIAFSLVLGNPFPSATRKFTPLLLQSSVVGLGAGMNLFAVARVGAAGFVYTALGIISALGGGWLIGKILKAPREAMLLVSVGTAICGGSAIAAVSPVLRAKPQEISVALGVVFILNALALLIFPPIGHALNLSQAQFGLWAALAIHDTSSVVGASMQYGADALQVATTVKLARALWIVPVTFAIGWMYARREGDRGSDGQEAKAKKPWFILGFLLAAAVVTWVPALQMTGHAIDALAKRALVLTLFLIGANLDRETLRAIGFRPMLGGILLWLWVGSTTLVAIVQGWIA